MYMWPCLCSCRPVVSPVVSNSSHWLTVASLPGDVQPNPGPAPQWKNPCGICSQAVHSNQKDICCDVCYELLHIKCMGMPNSEYQRLSTSDEGWCCNRCHKMAFPFDDCLTISDSSTNDSLCLPSNSSGNASDPTASLISSNRCSIYYSNCCSLAPKLDHLQAVASSVAATVIAACETWLKK